MKLLGLLFKNLYRNPLRTSLTSLGTILLVLVVVQIWSVLEFLSNETREKSSNFKAIVTERWQIPSQMPFAYAEGLARGGARKPGDIEPQDNMTWQFYGGTIDKENRTAESTIFFFAMDPAKVLTMLEELDLLTGPRKTQLEESVRKMQENKRGVIIGKDRLAQMNKRVGETITISGLNYRDLDLEMEIVGTFPEETRYDNSAVMNREYLLDALDAYPATHGGKEHPLKDKTLNLVWLRVPDRTQFETIANQIMSSPEFGQPAVKVETASSGVASFLDAFRDLLWGARYLLAPAIIATLALIMSNSISISVRERRMEMAVLKVLGFSPNQVMFLVLGEAVILGFISSLISVAGTYFVVNKVLGGFKLPIAFFSTFFVPPEAFLWATAVGVSTSLLGSIVPAITARNVKPAEVFSKVS